MAPPNRDHEIADRLVAWVQQHPDNQPLPQRPTPQHVAVGQIRRLTQLPELPPIPSRLVVVLDVWADRQGVLVALTHPADTGATPRDIALTAPGADYDLLVMTDVFATVFTRQLSGTPLVGHIDPDTSHLLYTAPTQSDTQLAAAAARRGHRTGTVDCHPGDPLWRHRAAEGDALAALADAYFHTAFHA